jgi:hypothetical protein
MGRVFYIIPDGRVAGLSVALRSVGVDVTVEHITVELTRERCAELGIDFQQSPLEFTQLHCKQGTNCIVLTVSRDVEGYYGIDISNPSSWWPPRKRERAKYQAMIMAVLEDQGAQWPYDD